MKCIVKRFSKIEGYRLFILRELRQHKAVRLLTYLCLKSQLRFFLFFSCCYKTHTLQLGRHDELISLFAAIVAQLRHHSSLCLQLKQMNKIRFLQHLALRRFFKSGIFQTEFGNTTEPVSEIDVLDLSIEIQSTYTVL